MIEYIQSCYEKKQPLEQTLHEKAMLLFKQYMLVGGMPKSVSLFLENHKDFDEADVEKRDILDLYRSDIMKIDVKSGKTYSTTSLLRFCKKFKTRIGECYVIHPKNLCKKDGILCIPPYMTIML